VSEVCAPEPGPMNIGEEASRRWPCPIRPRRFSPAPSASPPWREDTSAAADAACGVVEVKVAPSDMGGVNFDTLSFDDVTTPGFAHADGAGRLEARRPQADSVGLLMRELAGRI